jgi:hypothetical protein
MGRTLSRVLVVAGLSAGSVLGASCERPSSGAAGSGYGAGIPRQAFTLRGEPSWQGGSKLGFPDPTRPPEKLFTPAVSAANRQARDHLAIGRRLSAKTP